MLQNVKKNGQQRINAAATDAGSVSLCDAIHTSYLGGFSVSYTWIWIDESCHTLPMSPNSLWSQGWSLKPYLTEEIITRQAWGNVAKTR